MIRQLLIVVGCGMEMGHAQDANEEDAVNMAYAIGAFINGSCVLHPSAMNCTRLLYFSMGFFQLCNQGCKGQAVNQPQVFFLLYCTGQYRAAG